ncbi:hypothetical protein FKM82_029675 [Ascaphus truei]
MGAGGRRYMECFNAVRAGFSSFTGVGGLMPFCLLAGRETGWGGGGNVCCCRVRERTHFRHPHFQRRWNSFPLTSSTSSPLTGGGAQENPCS